MPWSELTIELIILDKLFGNLRLLFASASDSESESDPEIPESRPFPPRSGRENSQDFPDPDWAGIGKISGIPAPLPDFKLAGNREIGESRFGRDREKAGICASINRDQDRDRDSGSHFLRCWYYPSPVGGLKGKKVKWKRAEAGGSRVHRPGPFSVAMDASPLMGSKGPYSIGPSKVAGRL
jgi:hypothetical protein